MALATVGLVSAAPTAGAAATTLYSSLPGFTGPVASAATVPAGACFVTITAAGGEGAGGNPNPTGGAGATVTARVPVSAGSVLQVLVGGPGEAPDGGVGGGGGGINGSVHEDGGGGASAVSTGSTPLLVAGGGGGSGEANAGGAAGPIGGNGSPGAGFDPGGGGTSTGVSGGGGFRGGTGGTVTITGAPAGANGGTGGDGNGSAGGGGGGSSTSAAGTAANGGAGGSGSGAGGSGASVGGTGGAGGSPGGNGGPAQTNGGGGGGGAVGVGGGGGGQSGGGGAGYAGGGGAGGADSGGGGGSSFAAPGATAVQYLGPNSGSGQVTITYDPSTDRVLNNPSRGGDRSARVHRVTLIQPGHSTGGEGIGLRTAGRYLRSWSGHPNGSGGVGVCDLNALVTNVGDLPRLLSAVGTPNGDHRVQYQHQIRRDGKPPRSPGRIRLLGFGPEPAEHRRAQRATRLSAALEGLSPIASGQQDSVDSGFAPGYPPAPSPCWRGMARNSIRPGSSVRPMGRQRVRSKSGTLLARSLVARTLPREVAWLRRQTWDDIHQERVASATCSSSSSLVMRSTGC